MGTGEGVTCRARPQECRLVLPVPGQQLPLLRGVIHCSLKAVDLLGGAFPPALTVCSGCVGTARSPHPRSRAGSRNLGSG